MTTTPLAHTPPSACTGYGALSDPLRWWIVGLLTGGERCVCELEATTGLAQSRLSYHLSILRQADLVTSRKEGRWVYYSLSPDVLEGLASALTELASECRATGPDVGGTCCD